MEDRLEGARVEAGSPVTGPAAVGARGGGGRAVGGGRDSRQERKEVAGLGTSFERRMDETCPLCPPPSDSPGLSLYDPAVPPTPTADFSSFPAFLGILLRSNQEWPVRVLPWGFLTGPLLASSQGRCYCLCFTGRHQDPDSLNEWPWSPGP